MSAIDLYAKLTSGFDERIERATAMLQSAASKYPGAVVQATSLGAEDMVLTDIVARHRLDIAIATLETGKLHTQTLDMIARIAEHYGIAVELYRPEPEQVLHFVKANGERAMYDSVALRKACCGIRKLEPLSRMLAKRSAWLTGLRREQSANRGEVPFREFDEHGRAKLNPLADWSWADVWHYIATHEVPYNALHDHFYPSIGCEPCTRAIAVGEDFRSGRWWWEIDSLKECGLHVSEKVSPIGGTR